MSKVTPHEVIKIEASQIIEICLRSPHLMISAEIEASQIIEICLRSQLLMISAEIEASQIIEICLRSPQGEDK